MSERDPNRRGSARGPGIRLLPPYQDPPRRPVPEGLQLLSDPMMSALPSPAAARFSSSLPDEVTVMLPSLEPVTEPLQSLRSLPPGRSLTVEREEEPSLVSDPTDAEILTGTMALTPRFEALWVDTQSTWAAPSPPKSDRVGLRDLRLVLGAFLLLCVAAGVFAYWTAGDSDRVRNEQTVSSS